MAYSNGPPICLKDRTSVHAANMDHLLFTYCASSGKPTMTTTATGT